MQRRLSAILAADVVGWSLLVRKDEEGSLTRLKTLRQELIDPVVARRAGRVFKLMGDGILVEFGSAVEAVRCAVELQRAMTRRNDGVAGDTRIAFRIGIHVGDVVVDGDDLHGNGVNVAARLEPLAPSGGICISDLVHEQVRGKDLPDFEDMGQLELKNIDRPLRGWKWLPSWNGPGTPAQGSAVLDLPSKPSIAVLPFNSMSSDPEQEYFADGMVEDIITALSRIETLFVIARNSSFTYKGRPVDVQQVGRELGVRYVVEGSVRAVGSRLRVNAQLIDARNAAHVWAERYDRQVEDVFQVQDEITRSVVASTQTHIDLAEGAALASADPISLSVWSLANRAWSLVYTMRQPELSQAVSTAERTVAMDPSSGRAHFVLATSLFHRAWMRLSEDPAADHRRALAAAETAVQLSPSNEYVRWQLGLCRSFSGQHDLGIAELERAIEINPNCSLAHGSLGTILNLAGQPDRAIASNEIAMRANPRDPSMFYRYAGMAVSHWMIGRLVDATSWAKRAIQDKPDFLVPHLMLVAALQELTRHEDAVAALAALRARRPDIALEDASILPFRMRAHLDRLSGSLQAAGLAPRSAPAAGG
ncbi:MAG: hypothetical protein RLZZ276_2586 [Pseudomonadota bacterium]|jgi:adenylate cyclase